MVAGQARNSGLDAMRRRKRLGWGSPLGQQSGSQEPWSEAFAQIGNERMNESECSDRLADRPGLNETADGDAANDVFEAMYGKVRFEVQGSSSLASPYAPGGLTR